MAKAGNVCQYFQCGVSKRVEPNLKMYGFPFKDENLCRVWINNAGATHLIPLSPNSLKNKKICEKHFRLEDFTKSSNERLIKGTVPMKYDFDTEHFEEHLHVNKPLKVYTRKKEFPHELLRSPSPQPSTSFDTMETLNISPDTSVWLNSLSSLPSPPEKNAKRKLQFKNDTPKEKKLRLCLSNQRKLLSRKRADMSRLKKSLKKKNATLSALSSNSAEYSYSLLKKDPKTFVDMNLFHKNNTSWNKNEKEFAIWLYYSSPSTYRGFLQKGFKLPSLATIKRWIGASVFKPGFTKQFFHQLQLKAQTFDSIEKKCVLCLDEMSIMSIIEYSKSLDCIEGYEDLGLPFGRRNKRAKKAMVFMLRGLHSKWKLPIAYFLSHTGPNSKELTTLIQDAIIKIKSCGLQLKAIICDQATTNVSTFKQLLVSKEKPYFFFEGQQIYVVYDVPHLIKSLRNNLLNGDYIINDKQPNKSSVRYIKLIGRVRFRNLPL
ncbi:uncharacterized protein LOC116163356 [Photinus pyralis]|nr:uncharacterized protein LOC116163356 [Photinus pyralis]